MSSYILLERIKVENANALAGFTYGFPAITSFLGFQHVLSLKCKEQFGIEFTGCAIFCHDYEINSYQQYYTRFIQNRCPPPTLKNTSSGQKRGEKVPIIEEAKMDMVVSILLRCNDSLSTNDDVKNSYMTQLKTWVYQARLSGGTIHHIRKIHIVDNNLETLKNKVLPSYVLKDASHYLQEHQQYCQEQGIEKTTFDVWTDFFAFKEQSVQDDENQTIEWKRIIPPNKKGWIVPLMVGFRRISPLYQPVQVENLRDTRYPFTFVEAIHGLGEWQSSHRITDIETLFWRYDVHDEWYLCTQQNVKHQQPVRDTRFED
ncbi:type I-F CRISPR-associated protein Csy2 [Moraxella catarrhalis]|uniref:type I-F CRISPR-associated protein Csy2 n=3 Tax=Moraxella catarrhalis TaxID=480 RepID=UPI0007E31308|nr:type I-F CRISPR-associated protein Csy2 [Moraxella catarrhalis]MPW63273.1 type I-F CRISPR-associated protein Csy2 [Moraxella catarrhalis]OAV07804.1 CRISPR-associated protein, Csy2 family [Moraxella catarrhalis]OAV21951.1 CRISPR-associated protein, Csy2 family [Moraxella catarrhalis]OAV30766.1 CRISPR-associated protein, Csy2 family [Moraxella catarrhalis]OBX43420.1 type I-F CRISPR-associated protein Csy2 [Moraxella catarrhalis]